MIRNILFASAIAALAVSPAFAADIIVKKDGSGAHTTIGAAISAANAGDVIKIQDVGPYNEALLISKSLTIKGDGFKPVIVAPNVTTGLPSTTLNGCAVAITTTVAGAITVNLENFIVIPDLASVPARGIRSNNNAAGLTADEMTVNITDVLVTANNGSGAPVTTDGLSLVTYPVGAKPFTDDAFFFAGNVSATLTRAIASNIYGADATASPDGIVFNPDTAGHTLTINAGTVVSYMKRLGIQIAGDGSIVRMNGTAGSPILFKGNCIGSTTNPALAIWQDNNSVAANDHIYSYVYVVDNKGLGIGTGFADPADSTPKLVADHLVVANNDGAGILVATNQNQPWAISSSTIVNNDKDLTGSTPAISFEPGAATIATSYTFTDSIIAGNGSTDSTAGNNSINIAGAGPSVVLNNVGLPASGLNRLSASFVTSGTGVAPTIGASVTADPQFVNTTDTANAGFVDVANNAYAGQSSTAGNLSGAGDYVGSAATDAKGWTLYE